MLSGFGGAIRATGGTLDVLRSRFDSNASAVNGGTINVTGTLTTVRHSVFTRNLAFDVGAALHFGHPTDRPDQDVLIDHCTFVGNDAGVGGVVHLANNVEAALTVTNSLFVESGLYAVDVDRSGGNDPERVRYNGYFANAGDTEPIPLVFETGTRNIRLQDPRFAAGTRSSPSSMISGSSRGRR